ncbi:hypothetical protein BC828DRAFT_382179 [Blastocladiella britannica]|nr:hypothetical protein BC828DRAFT_382179 [Blastocladiella britannica]
MQQQLKPLVRHIAPTPAARPAAEDALVLVLSALAARRHCILRVPHSEPILGQQPENGDSARTAVEFARLLSMHALDTPAVAIVPPYMLTAEMVDDSDALPPPPPPLPGQVPMRGFVRASYASATTDGGAAAAFPTLVTSVLSESSSVGGTTIPGHLRSIGPDPSLFVAPPPLPPLPTATPSTTCRDARASFFAQLFPPSSSSSPPAPLQPPARRQTLPPSARFSSSSTAGGGINDGSDDISSIGPGSPRRVLVHRRSGHDLSTLSAATSSSAAVPSGPLAYRATSAVMVPGTAVVLLAEADQGWNLTVQEVLVKMLATRTMQIDHHQQRSVPIPPEFLVVLVVHDHVLAAGLSPALMHYFLQSATFDPILDPATLGSIPPEMRVSRAVIADLAAAVDSHIATVTPSLLRYARAVALAIRTALVFNTQGGTSGSSQPRFVPATLADNLVRAAAAVACVYGVAWITPDQVRAVAGSVAAHCVHHGGPAGRGTVGDAGDGLGAMVDAAVARVPVPI